ncbi:MAG TPA: Gfo/Idh/MocA family oxidoreductase [Caproiciproducens sp.]|nr:Gfo/Idh/MocA family oxidoreductase [Caproiciproducens sp.]
MYHIGIIGYGGMGAWHAEQLQSMPDFHLSGVYDINPEKIRLAAAHGIAGYSSLDGILEDTSVQTVILAVPNNFHKELSIRALRAGKNVICEKPVTICSADLKEIIKTAKETGRLFSVHQNRRWDRDFLTVKKVLEDGTIGQPFYIESRVQGSKGIPGDWRCVKEAGGGMLLDWGIHLIDQLMWLIKSPVTEVYTHMFSIKFKEVDDNFKLMIRFENGLSALVEVDTCTFINLPRWHVSGDGGTMQVDDFSCTGKIVKANETEINWDEGIVYTSAGPTRTMVPRPKNSLQELPLPLIESDSRDYYRNFRDADTNGAELAVKPGEALRVMRVVDAVFESAQKHQSVHVHI